MKSKYFRESGNNHYDSRYYRGDLPSSERRRILIEILKSFIWECDRIQAKAILMHGGLIGWFWNQQLLPWDNDIDICMLMGDFQLIASDSILLEKRGRYILDINPNYATRATMNRDHREEIEPNKIDARFIDTSNGLYIDITILVEMQENTFSTKCPHHYQIHDILPLVLTHFETIPIYVPNNSEQILNQEYGSACTQNSTYGSWVFDPKLNDWFETRL